MLHLAGVKAVNPKYEALGELAVPLDDIKRFRQLDSRCPGHPEYRWTSGRRDHHRAAGPGRGHQRRHGHRLEVAGRALQPPRLRDVRLRRLRPGGDGCMMEGDLRRGGVAGRPPEARQPLLDLRQQPASPSRATPTWPSARTWPRASSAYGWNVTRVGDANDLGHAATAPSDTRSRHQDRPTLIIVDSHIGYGAPNKQDTHAAHGEPLGDEEIRLTKRFYGWPEDAKFLVPDGVREHFASGIGARGAKLRGELDGALRGATSKEHPSWPTSSTACSTGSSPTAGTRTCPVFPADAKGLAGRDASAKVLNALAPERALADRRLRRPGALHQDAAHLRGRRRLPRRNLRRPQLPLRHPRARHGRDR